MALTPIYGFRADNGPSSCGWRKRGLMKRTNSVTCLLRFSAGSSEELSSPVNTATSTRLRFISCRHGWVVKLVLWLYVSEVDGELLLCLFVYGSMIDWWVDASSNADVCVCPAVMQSDLRLPNWHALHLEHKTGTVSPGRSPQSQVWKTYLLLPLRNGLAHVGDELWAVCDSACSHTHVQPHCWVPVPARTCLWPLNSTIRLKWSETSYHPTNPFQVTVCI